MKKAITAVLGVILLFLLMSCSQKQLPPCSTYKPYKTKQIKSNAHRDATGIPVKVKSPNYQRRSYDADSNGIHR